MSISEPTYNELRSWLAVERTYSDDLRLERDAARGEALRASLVGEKLAEQVDNMAAAARAAPQRGVESSTKLAAQWRRIRELEAKIEAARELLGA